MAEANINMEVPSKFKDVVAGVEKLTLLDLAIHGNIHIGSGEEVDKIRMIKSQKLAAGITNATRLEFALG